MTIKTTAKTTANKTAKKPTVAKKPVAKKPTVAKKPVAKKPTVAKKAESTMSKARKVYARMFKSAVKKDGKNAVVNRQKFLKTMIETHAMTANGASSYFTTVRDSHSEAA